MRYDFSTVDDVDQFVTIPEGVYICRVADVRVTRTKHGDARWGLRLDVAEGDFAGRFAAWDGLVWNDQCIHRVKTVLAALGLDVAGEVEIEAPDLIGRRARVLLVVEEWEDELRGRRQIRLAVPWNGFEPADFNGTEGEPMAAGAGSGAG